MTLLQNCDVNSKVGFVSLQSVSIVSFIVKQNWWAWIYFKMLFELQIFVWTIFMCGWGEQKNWYSRLLSCASQFATMRRFTISCQPDNCVFLSTFTPASCTLSKNLRVVCIIFFMCFIFKIHSCVYVPLSNSVIFIVCIQIESSHIVPSAHGSYLYSTFRKKPINVSGQRPEFIYLNLFFVFHVFFPSFWFFFFIHLLFIMKILSCHKNPLSID